MTGETYAFVGVNLQGCRRVTFGGVESVVSVSEHRDADGEASSAKAGVAAIAIMAAAAERVRFMLGFSENCFVCYVTNVGVEPTSTPNECQRGWGWLRVDLPKGLPVRNTKETRFFTFLYKKANTPQSLMISSA